MNKSTDLISKTAYLKLEQCEKAFYFYKKHPYLRDKVSIDKQLTFNRGHFVGDLAQKLFPDGIDVSKNTKNATEGLLLTQNLIEQKTPIIYEATLAYNNALIMVDILCLENEKYTAYEVKSSFKISEIYLKDACLQYYVLKNTLLNIDDFFLVTLNQDYVFNGELNIKQLFKKRSIKDEGEKNAPYFHARLLHGSEILDQTKIPNTAIGKQCFKPYQCDYFGTCWKGVFDDNSIFNLPLINKEKLFEWYNNGIKTIEQVDETLEAKEIIYKIQRSHVENTPIVNRERIQLFLEQLKSPFAALDMEMWGPAIPQIIGTKPFEQLPYLACIFDGKMHSSVFIDYTHDERKLFVLELLEKTRLYNSILVFDGTMEKMVINNLIKLNANYKDELENLKNKFIDVFEIFLAMDYYHPSFKTNFSLKTIASILLKEVSYSKIASGLEAMNYYEQYLNDTTTISKNILKEELIEYCQTDTLATYKLVSFLEEIVNKKP